jgi:tetratricopeptide (TPR) repeat protein
LTQDAARQTFLDIADDSHSVKEIDKILLLTDNMPLAIDLIAHLVDLDGLPAVLSRWEKEKTSVLSEGYDKQSNLDLSISLSFASPRMTSSPEAQSLLSLLSMLPDGLSDVDLLQSKLPIDDILRCKVTLLSTSLVFMDERKQFKMLSPIREYIQKFHPPRMSVVQPLLRYYQELLDLHHRYFGTLSSSGTSARITSHFVNIQNILLHSLNNNNPDLIVDTIYCACYFHTFSLHIGWGNSPLLNNITNFLPQPSNHPLELYVCSQILNSWKIISMRDPEALIQKAQGHLPHVEEVDIKCELLKEIYSLYSQRNPIGIFYRVLGDFQRYKHDIPAAINSYQAALSLASSVSNVNRQSQALSSMAEIHWKLGDYHRGQMSGYEAQRLARIHGNLFREANALEIEARCWYSLGNYSTALPLCSRARELLSLCGMSDGDLDCTVMATQAEIQMLKSEYMEAQKIYKHMLSKVIVELDPWHHAMCLLNLAQLNVPMGTLKHELHKDLDTAKSIFITIDYMIYVAWCDSVQADLNLREGNLLAANRMFQKCLSFSQGTDSEMTTYCLEKLGEGSRWSPGFWASSWTTVYLAHALKTKQRLHIFRSLEFLGDVFLAEGDQHTATTLYTVALDGFTEMDVHRNRAECMVRLGDTSKNSGDLLNAMELWTTARPLFERSSQTKQIMLLDQRIASIPGESGYEKKFLVFHKLLIMALQHPWKGACSNQHMLISGILKLEKSVYDKKPIAV